MRSDRTPPGIGFGGDTTADAIERDDDRHVRLGAMMEHLILVKHGLPEIDPGTPAAEWRLGEEGRRQSAQLAERLVGYQPQAVVTSVEPKAAETGAIVAARLDVSTTTAAGLHEHERRGVGFLEPMAFDTAIERFFARPNDLVLGEETATQAHRRFAAAVDQVLGAYPRGDVVIVAHGTVISLFVAACAGVEPFALWSRLGLPSYVVLSRPTLGLVSTVARLDERTGLP